MYKESTKTNLDVSGMFCGCSWQRPDLYTAVTPATWPYVICCLESKCVGSERLQVLGTVAGC